MYILHVYYVCTYVDMYYICVRICRATIYIYIYIIFLYMYIYAIFKQEQQIHSGETCNRKIMQQLEAEALQTMHNNEEEDVLKRNYERFQSNILQSCTPWSSQCFAKSKLLVLYNTCAVCTASLSLQMRPFTLL